MSNIVVSGLFVSATQTGVDVYEALRNKKQFDQYQIELVKAGDTTCRDCDLLICASYTALVSIKSYLNANMTVVVCDGPLVLSCLTTAMPLDYIRRFSYKFEFRPADYGLLLPALRHRGPGITLLADSFDVLGLVTANTVTGNVILTEFNKVQSYFDALARNRLRFLLVQVLTAKDYKPAAVEMQTFLKTECTQPEHKKDALNFWNKLLKGGALKLMRDCLSELEAGKNIAGIAKKYDVSQYELNYVRKMSSNLDTAAARTEAYAQRTKGMEAIG